MYRSNQFFLYLNSFLSYFNFLKKTTIFVILLSICSWSVSQPKYEFLFRFENSLFHLLVQSQDRNTKIIWRSDILMLIHFLPLVSFYTPWKRQKTRGLWGFQELQKEISGMKWIKYKQLFNAFIPNFEHFFFTASEQLVIIFQ